MKIQHNMLAMNASRQLSATKNRMFQSQEKLSSGFQINRAADDAAGLSISEKMRRQIRGLDRTLDNMQEGIGLCQVADGALAEVHEILQRMNELAVKAANGTNSASDRRTIQQETDQLITEIDRIAYSTKVFRVHPLLGDATINKTTYLMPANTINALKNAEIFDGKGSIQYMANGMSMPFAGTWTGADTKPFISVRNENGYVTGKVEMTDNANMTYVNYKGQDKFVSIYNDGTISFQVELTWKKVDCSTDSESREYFEFAYNFINTSASELTFDFWMEMDMLVGVASGSIPTIDGTEVKNTYKWTGSDIPEEMTVDNFVNLPGTGNTNVNVSAQYNWDGIQNKPDIVMSGDRNGIGFDQAMNGTSSSDLGYQGNDYFYGIGWKENRINAGSSFLMQSRIGLYAEKDARTETHKFVGNPPVWIQMGADSGVGMSIEICNATAGNLGVDDVSMRTEKEAERAIKTVAAAIQKVSGFRSYFGVQQNRLEHAVLINSNVLENTQAAESAIRDTDMAEMMMKYSVANIIIQAGQSMLSNANHDAERVLQLLQ